MIDLKFVRDRHRRRDHRECGGGAAADPELAQAVAAGAVQVDCGRGLGGVGDGAQQGADGVLVHGQASSAGTDASARRSALSPLAVWLFTVPGVHPSSFAVSSTGRSQ
jgi:hypothetical protein